jgi:AcrR family transcriptional regulator
MDTLKNGRVDVAGLRRKQIVEAAVAVITEQGLQNLSLSEIEKKTGMRRGQLTYYFHTKEEILLAVFDYLVMLIHLRVGTPGGQPCGHESLNSGWAWIEHLLTTLVGQPPVSPEFSCLQYTFLSQIAHREDFRQRLAMLYEAWRCNMTQGIAADQARTRSARPVPPRAMASVVQALLHGLSTQLEADPNAFDREEVLALCLDLLGAYLRIRPTVLREKMPKNRRSPTNKKTARAAAAVRVKKSLLPRGKP